MGSFGVRLQREREMRGISLDEIAEATKIGTRSLKALESGEFDKLPGGIFNKGFVRAYARYLGIDEDQAVSDYLTAVGEAEQNPPVPADDAKPAAAKLMVIEAPEEESSAAAPLAVLLAIVLVIAGLGYGGWRYYQARRANASARRVGAPPAAFKPAVIPPAQAAAPPVSSPPAAAPRTNAETASSTPAPKTSASSAPSASDQQGFELLIRAREDSWMSITADGKEVMSGTLKAESARSVRAHDRVVVKVGNAGGVQISYNGKPVAPVGDAGQTRTLTFTPSGLQQ